MSHGNDDNASSYGGCSMSHSARIRQWFAPAPIGATSTGQEGFRHRIGPPDATDRMRIAARLKALHGDVQRTVLPGLDVDAESDAIAGRLVNDATTAVRDLLNGTALGALPVHQLVALESVVQARGRPALRVKHQGLEGLDPHSGFWRTLLEDHEDAITRAVTATGAVSVTDNAGMLPGWVQGTAWLIRPDLVITNRHVLFPPSGVHLARRRFDTPTRAQFKNDISVTIDFAYDDANPRSLRHRVLDVPFVAEDRDPVDVALIRVEPIPTSLLAPQPLGLAAPSVDIGALKQLYVIGHPGRLAEVPDEVQAVFGILDERKRVSLGAQMPANPFFPNDVVHDASTIGGYSGGCVHAFFSTDVVALHYLGDPAGGNRAVSASALRSHAVAAFLC